MPRLVIEITEAKDLFMRKDANFEDISNRCAEQYPEAYLEWQAMDREETQKVGKETRSPYRFRKYKCE